MFAFQEMVEGKKPGFKLEKVGQVSFHVCETSEIENVEDLQLRLFTLPLLRLESSY